MLRPVYHGTYTITASTQKLLPALDLSNGDELLLEIRLTGNAGAGASDKLNVYLQSRGLLGVWDDRIATAQFLGTDVATEVRQYVLQKRGDLPDAEEASEPSGSSGGSRLPAGSVKNGTFPGRYRRAGIDTITAWQLDFVVTSGSAPSFPVEVWVQCDSRR